MTENLYDFYTNAIRSWHPTKPSKQYESLTEIARYAKDFERGCLEHVRGKLEGQVIIKKGEGSKRNIGIITEFNGPTLLAKFIEGDNRYRNRSYATITLKKLEVLNRLTPGQKERKELIMKKIDHEKSIKPY